MAKIMISVGEASGDLHGASVATAIKELNPQAHIFGMGGINMKNSGVEIYHDIADLGVIGFVEVIKNLRKLFKLKADLVALMKKERPDVLVVIDYPDFNMRLAKAAQKLNIPVISYISPSAWAWRPGRAKDVATVVDCIAAIFPFEAEFYKKAGANVEFVGHPLLDIVKPELQPVEAYQYFQASSEQPLVLLLPGSRKQEINNLLPEMLKAAEEIITVQPKVQFYLPVASTIPRKMIEDILKQYKVKVKLTSDKNYALMSIADVGIASSGTVTLEAAILKLPTVVIYKLAFLTYLLGKLLVKIPYFSLPNIIAGKALIPELLQKQANYHNIAQETIKILENSVKMKQEMNIVTEKLGQGGAVKKVATLILSYVKA